MKKPMLCRLGLHAWEFRFTFDPKGGYVYGGHNACTRCGATKKEAE